MEEEEEREEEKEKKGKVGKGLTRGFRALDSSINKLSFDIFTPPIPTPTPCPEQSWEPDPDFIIEMQAPCSSQGDLPGPALILLFFLVENFLLLHTLLLTQLARGKSL